MARRKATTAEAAPLEFAGEVAPSLVEQPTDAPSPASGPVSAPVVEAAPAFVGWEVVADCAVTQYGVRQVFAAGRRFPADIYTEIDIDIWTRLGAKFARVG
jgi:hypothetical protein